VKVGKFIGKIEHFWARQIFDLLRSMEEVLTGEVDL